MAGQPVREDPRRGEAVLGRAAASLPGAQLAGEPAGDLVPGGDADRQPAEPATAYRGALLGRELLEVVLNRHGSRHHEALLAADREAASGERARARVKPGAERPPGHDGPLGSQQGLD